MTSRSELNQKMRERILENLPAMVEVLKGLENNPEISDKQRSKIKEILERVEGTPVTYEQIVNSAE